MFQRFCCASFALAFLAFGAQAGVITFEGHPVDGNETISHDGFTFFFTASGWGVFTDEFNAGFYTRNSTTRLVLQGERDGLGRVTMSQTDTNPFSLQSFDAATAFPNFSGTILITGNLSGGGTVSTSVDVTDIFGPFVLVGFNNLASVVFAESVSGEWTTTAGLSLDNLTVNEPGGAGAVPEPGLAGLVALCLGALAVFSRRK